ncbi:hypothetical protein [Gloeobacter morelensis]|uniref:WG repeat-containing protein n=1 Tax=Gloeobacter morelensis MG652769 TaxID=2781736 RepID=A0ABY3PTZ9_9CYAN|nr:hypothetical protein ISF26_10560 [Gloeobacter morelensis MG652769]
MQPKFYNSVESFVDGLARVWLDGKSGYIDRTGKLVWTLTQ